MIMIFHFPTGFLELEKYSVCNLPNRDLTKGFSPTGTKQKVSPQLGLNKGFSPTWTEQKVSPQSVLSKDDIHSARSIAAKTT